MAHYIACLVPYWEMPQATHLMSHMPPSHGLHVALLTTNGGLGLNAAKDRGIRNIKVFGHANLIIQQVNKIFQAKHLRLKAYRDEVWRLKDSFDNFCISYIPRAKNQLVDSLVVFASPFIPPMPPRLVYEVQMKYRP